MDIYSSYDTIHSMKCSHCGQKTSVKQTRQPDGFGNRFLKKLADDWPELVCRRRHCENPECGRRCSTVELPVEDLHNMLVDVARQAAQMVTDG